MVGRNGAEVEEEGGTERLRDDEVDLVRVLVEDVIDFDRVEEERDWTVTVVADIEVDEKDEEVDWDNACCCCNFCCC